MEVSTEMLYGSVFLYHYESTQANGVIHRQKLIKYKERWSFSWYSSIGGLPVGIWKQFRKGLGKNLR